MLYSGFSVVAGVLVSLLAVRTINFFPEDPSLSTSSLRLPQVPPRPPTKLTARSVENAPEQVRIDALRRKIYMRAGARPHAYEASRNIGT
eukprot:6190903-Pleurochrysis_carterae.AAC.1